MENTVTTIFLGGSKTIGHLPEDFIDRLDFFISEGNKFIIGDAHGADLAIQNYLHSKGCKNVTVYCSGDKCHFNVGDWKTERVYDENECPRLYDEMVEVSNCAFLIWDGESQETANIIKSLRQRGLPIFIYRTDRDALSVIRRNSKLNNK